MNSVVIYPSLAGMKTETGHETAEIERHVLAILEIFLRDPLQTHRERRLFCRVRTVPSIYKRSGGYLGFTCALVSHALLNT